MSTILYQNLISCFDSQLTHNETTTTSLKLTVTTLDLCKSSQLDVKTNLEFGNWGCIQTTVNNSKELGDCKESCYSHPWVTKPSFSRLTARSLELCTENLGSETGTDIITDGSTISRPLFNSGEISTTTSFEEQNIITTNNFPPRNNSHHQDRAKSYKKATNFPPPLTTMIGSSPLQVRRRREGGRLIIEAVETPFWNSYLEAERIDGRLRLRYFTPPPETASELDDEEEEEIGEEAAEVEEEIEGGGFEIESEKEELMEGEMKNVETYQQRLSRRCKEGSHGSKELMSNWKPAALWVATS